MRYRNLIFFCVTAFMFFTVLGQQNKWGAITGTVKDASTKSPITEAVITLSSDAFKGQKFAVTDSAGIYKINNLPPGNYKIVFEMEGYQKFVRDSVTLKDGMSLGVDYNMIKERKSS